MLTASLQDRILLAKGVPQITIMHELCPSYAMSTVTATDSI